jgi:hypothetical protein
MAYGIDIESFPLSTDGEVKMAHHLKWLAKRKIKEAALQTIGSFAGIDLPGRHDVLLGRGKPFQQHPGNVRMREMVDLYKEEYTRVPVGQKSNIADKILQTIMIKEHSFFLKRQPDGWWVQVSENEAREKVAHAFRTARSTRTKDRHRYVETDNRKRSKIQQQQQRDVPCFGFPCGGGQG